MFVVGEFVKALAGVLNLILNALLAVILINAILTWVRPDPRNPIVAFLDRVSDFVCDPIRRLVPTSFGGLDFAPFIAMLLIYFVLQFVVGSLAGLALRMGSG